MKDRKETRYSVSSKWSVTDTLLFDSVGVST
jgi:hypothetical protein